MGYEIHITRAEDWTSSGETPITLEEWLAYVESDPDCRHDGFAEATTPQGDTIRVENQGLTVWTAYSQDGEGGNHAWIDYRDGCLVVKGVDQEILRKLHQIATHFGARVQGDDGEEYGPDGQQLGLTPAEDSATEKKPGWWRRLFGGAG